MIVKNPAAFASRYGTGISILGTYTDSLDNSGELIRIVDANGLRVAQLAYSGAWQDAADGGGHSLVVIDENASQTTMSAAPINWAAEPVRARLAGDERAGGGRRGFGGRQRGAQQQRRRRGLDRAAQHDGGRTSTCPGWYLTDSASDSFKYRIPAGMVVPANGYLVLTELEHFGQTGGPGVATRSR